MSSINSAIILAGGKGERLRPHTAHKPKVMVEVGSRPIIEWVIEWLKMAGINNIVLATGYRSEVIEKKYGNGQSLGVKVAYSVEPKALGTGGATKLALSNPVIQDGDDVLVVNGDILTDLSLKEMIKHHQANKPLVTMLAVPISSPWDVLELGKSDQVVGYATKPQLPYYISGGVFIFNRRIRELLPDNGNQEDTVFPKLSSNDLLAYKANVYWRAIDTVKDKTEVEKNLDKLYTQSRNAK